jgi:hypothetical protein
MHKKIVTGTKLFLDLSKLLGLQTFLMSIRFDACLSRIFLLMFSVI